MDCDLQDPPEEIPRLLAKAGEGYDIVLSKRVGRKHSLPRRVAGRAYIRIRNFFMRMDMGTEYSSLSLLSRKVVDAFLAVRDRDRQYMLVIHWLGFARGEIEFEHADRMAGRSSYTTRQLMQVAIEGFFFETTILLRGSSISALLWRCWARCSPSGSFSRTSCSNPTRVGQASPCCSF